MSRVLIRDCPPIPERRKTLPDLSDFDITVAAPMFGGGVSPGKVDPTMMIRPSAVRGHLRFWWRATRGAEIAAVDQLRQDESALWGATEQRSLVEVSVSVTHRGSAYPPRDALKYVLFPFTGSEGSPGREGVRFTLHVRCPSFRRPEVVEALRAWVNFGGVGARTRRGCGALYCPALALRTEGEMRDGFRWNGN